MRPCDPTKLPQKPIQYLEFVNHTTRIELVLVFLQLFSFLLLVVVCVAIAATISLLLLLLLLLPSILLLLSSLLVSTTNEWIIFLHRTTSTRTHMCVYNLYCMLHSTLKRWFGLFGSFVFNGCFPASHLCMFLEPKTIWLWIMCWYGTFICQFLSAFKYNTHTHTHTCLRTDIVDKIFLIRIRAYKQTRQCDKWTD